MIRLKFLLIILLSVYFSEGYCSDVIIKFIVQKDSSYRGDKIADYLLDIVPNKSDHLDKNSQQAIPAIKTLITNNENEEVIVVKYNIAKAGCYFIKEFLGHEILLRPSTDTIVVKMSRIYTKMKIDKREMLALNDSILSPWMWKLSFSNENKYIGFFDSLAYVQGDLRSNLHYSLKRLNNNLPEYLSLVNKVYADRMEFYKEFIRNYSMPSELSYYAWKEIQFCYYHDLLDPIVWKQKLIEEYPSPLLDTINDIKTFLNDQALFENISYYRTVINEYVCNAESSLSSPFINDSAYVINRMNYCKKNLKGVVKAYILASLMEKAGRMDSKQTLALLYKNYDHKKAEPGLNKFVDMLYNSSINLSAFTPEEIMGLAFEDSLNIKHTLKDLFNRDFILIDCWATWCQPCIKQIPDLDSLVNKYHSSVQFISISADQSTSKWKEWLTNSPNKNKQIMQLHAPESFENVFFKRLNINAIPRYILISKQGSILNNTMPYPSEKGKFEKIIDKYINKNTYSKIYTTSRKIIYR